MYPPKVHQFAYVTDEACTEDEILSMEIIIMKVKYTNITRWSMTHQDEFDQISCTHSYPTHKIIVVCSFHLFSNTGAELESEPTDSHLLAQCLHAGGLPERDRRVAPPQIPSDYLHTDRRGMLCVGCFFPTNTMMYPCSTMTESLSWSVQLCLIWQTFQPCKLLSGVTRVCVSHAFTIYKIMLDDPFLTCDVWQWQVRFTAELTEH